MAVFTGVFALLSFLPWEKLARLSLVVSFLAFFLIPDVTVRLFAVRFLRWLARACVRARAQWGVHAKRAERDLIPNLCLTRACVQVMCCLGVFVLNRCRQLHLPPPGEAGDGGGGGNAGRTE
jgi:hypothetical protein